MQPKPIMIWCWPANHGERYQCLSFEKNCQRGSGSDSLGAGAGAGRTVAEVVAVVGLDEEAVGAVGFARDPVPASVEHPVSTARTATVAATRDELRVR